MRKVDVKEQASDREKRVQQRWKKEDTFKQSISNREESTSFVFYEGPPTANGLPHAGHVLGRVIKDLVARYKTMAGYKVLRKAGWDTHGLPVELGVEKQLGISGKHDIEKYGIEKFINKCKESVFAYEQQWSTFTELIGYWVDVEDPYVTLENSYIESVWHILGTIHEQGLLYKGHRVSPYCPSCQTSLSSHEVAQGYKDVKDLSVTVKFPIKDREHEYLLGWTTTPWTLPANVALAINPQITYVKAKKGKEVYYVAEALAENVLQENYQLLSRMKGDELVGIAYDAPFDNIPVEKGHIVIEADFVTDSNGTGVVHIAPAYGEDDYRAAQQYELSFVNVVNESGRYTDDLPMFAGRFVKDCDVDIIKYLAANNLLFHKQKYEHSYPFCWRCDSPLLYYATDSWFIKMTAVKDRLLSNNEQVTWHPEHVKHGRFGKFLENVVDWNISRNRYWGTPLNIWTCEQCDQQFVPKSIQELQANSVEHVDKDLELHKPYVDDVKVECRSCGGNMNRTPEVVDVWFDSGSMPFAQHHYPFENGELFKDQFPADVIAEGIDQTRGWFYSLLAISTLFTGKAPYKRVLSLGHILDENGQKMSKSKGNVLDPLELIEEFGADALRWALIADSAPWNSKRFSKAVVAEAKSKLVDTFVNVHSFYTLYASIDQISPNLFTNVHYTSLDHWVLSRLNSTIRGVKLYVDDYQFTLAARLLNTFMDEVSNWYVRRTRQRFWREGMDDDKLAAYATLYEVLTKSSQLLAPFTPFVADDVFENLTGESVHLSDYPVVDDTIINRQLELEMDATRQIVELGRQARNNAGLKVKQPLQQLIIMTKDEKFTWLQSHTDIIKEELNVKVIMNESNESRYFHYSLKLNFKKAGSKYGKYSSHIHQYLQSQSASKVAALLETEELTVEVDDKKFQVSLEDIIVEKSTIGEYQMAEGPSVTVLLDTKLTADLLHEGKVRELIRAVQEYRKKLLLPVEKRIDISLQLDDEMLQAVNSFEHLLRENLLVNELEFVESLTNYEEVKVGSDTVRIVIK
ncbi:isoleucine--tRNA ligase [Bacillus sp. SCS-151]|uniref:isoleucine--tRNA ligase n=1 Tax=Nanhaiella sioensis TaxID=3115293 RepID=UPI00397BF9C1